VGRPIKLAKLGWYDKMVAAAMRFVPDFRDAVMETDMFTPTTIRRYTGHENGAIYGTPEKRYDGTTHLSNLFLCGNDQGLVGIVGNDPQRDYHRQPVCAARGTERVLIVCLGSGHDERLPSRRAAEYDVVVIGAGLAA
jgi:hypothetical protein